VFQFRVDPVANELVMGGNFRSNVGSTAQPSYGFNANPGLGLYSISTSTIGFAAGPGSRRMSLGDTHLEIGNGSSTGAPLLGRTHSIANPAYSFVGDDDSGMERLGGNIIAWAVGGVEKMYLSATQFRSPPIYDFISGSANVSVSSAGRLTQASSSMKHKTDFTPLVDPLSVIQQLNPFRFRPMGTLEDDRYRVGLGAEEVNAVIPEAKDDEGNNYDLRAVVAYLVAAVQQLAPA
jgi:hypothetical protein